MISIRKFYKLVVDLLETNHTLAVATIVEAKGSTPRDEGAKMIVLPDGTTHGSIGGGSLEKKVTDEALEAMRSKEGFLREYNLVDKDDGGIGSQCGGKTTVLVEVLTVPDLLLICGAGHIGQALAKMGVVLGMHVVVVDHREDYADCKRFPEQVKVIKALPSAEEVREQVNPNTYIVVVTHGHEYDKEALRALAPLENKYIGMIGSRRKALRTIEELKQEGMDQKVLESIHTPIGLDLGAEGPAEIAISILAEILHIKKKGTTSDISLKKRGKKKK